MVSSLSKLSELGRLLPVRKTHSNIGNGFDVMLNKVLFQKIFSWFWKYFASVASLPIAKHL